MFLGDTLFLCHNSQAISKILPNFIIWEMLHARPKVHKMQELILSLILQLVALSAPASVKPLCCQKAPPCVIKTCLVIRGCKKKGTPRATPFPTPAMPKQVCLSLSQDRHSTALSCAWGLIFKTQPEPEKKCGSPISLIPAFHNSTI